jgi:hypothetical protein
VIVVPLNLPIAGTLARGPKTSRLGWWLEMAKLVELAVAGLKWAWSSNSLSLSSYETRTLSGVRRNGNAIPIETSCPAFRAYDRSVGKDL